MPSNQAENDAAIRTLCQRLGLTAEYTGKTPRKFLLKRGDQYMKFKTKTMLKATLHMIYTGTYPADKVDADFARGAKWD